MDPASAMTLKNNRMIGPTAYTDGDIGALSLGAALGVVAVVVRQEIVLAIMGGVFVVETLSVMIKGQEIHDPDEIGGVACLRALIDVVRGAHLQQPAVFHDPDELYRDWPLRDRPAPAAQGVADLAAGG